MFRSFIKEDSGNIGLVASIVMLPLMAAVGIAVDISFAVKKRINLQDALDNATLAAIQVEDIDESLRVFEASLLSTGYTIENLGSTATSSGGFDFGNSSGGNPSSSQNNPARTSSGTSRRSGLFGFSSRGNNPARTSSGTSRRSNLFRSFSRGNNSGNNTTITTTTTSGNSSTTITTSSSSSSSRSSSGSSSSGSRSSGSSSSGSRSSGSSSSGSSSSGTSSPNNDGANPITIDSFHREIVNGNVELSATLSETYTTAFGSLIGKSSLNLGANATVVGQAGLSGLRFTPTFGSGYLRKTFELWVNRPNSSTPERLATYTWNPFLPLTYSDGSSPGRLSSNPPGDINLGNFTDFYLSVKVYDKFDTYEPEFLTNVYGDDLEILSNEPDKGDHFVVNGRPLLAQEDVNFSNEFNCDGQEKYFKWEDIPGDSPPGINTDFRFTVQGLCNGIDKNSVRLIK